MPIITMLFNNTHLNGTYPSSWFCGIISTVPKKGGLNIRDNYRGITVTSCVRNLFGIIMNEGLKNTARITT